MSAIIDIITVTKDDLEGVTATIKSTRRLRARHQIRQIIIDSSKKGTSEKIRRLISSEQNIEYIWQEPSGIAAAFNLGLRLSKAQWVWFLNGMDEVHHSVDPDKLLYIVRESRANAIIFEIELMQSSIRVSHPPIWNLWPPLCPNWIPHAATLLRRKLFDQYGLFNEEYQIAMDGELWLRFFSNRVTVDMISIPIALFDEGGIANTQIRENLKEVRKIIRSHFWALLKHHLRTAKLAYQVVYDVFRYCGTR